MAAALIALGLLAGCKNGSSLNPVNWWHQAEGGKIAGDRPEPPGADQPYPNLNSVPAKPTPPNQDELNKLTAALVADRTNAQHDAQAAPIADPSSPQASPQLFGVGTAPPPAPAGATPPAGGKSAGATPPSSDTPPAASASMQAVTAPPPPAAPATPAPRKPVQSAPLETPAASASASPAVPAPTVLAAPAQTSSAAPAPTALAPAQTSTAAADAAQPALPTVPPARPGAAGSPPAPVVTPPPMPAPNGAQNATIVFPEGSTSLSAPATQEVKAFGAKRGNGVIVVTGFGEAASGDPSAQSAAVNLGLTRAQAVVEALKAAGVPGNAIRVSAEATGRGASLVLVQ